MSASILTGGPRLSRRGSVQEAREQNPDSVPLMARRARPAHFTFMMIAASGQAVTGIYCYRLCCDAPVGTCLEFFALGSGIGGRDLVARQCSEQAASVAQAAESQWSTDEPRQKSACQLHPHSWKRQTPKKERGCATCNCQGQVQLGESVQSCHATCRLRTDR